MNDAGPLARYVTPLRRWWPVVVAVLVLGLAFTAFTLPEPPREPTAEEIADPNATFRATHLLIRNDASPEPINFDLVELLARQGDLTSRVLERMGDAISTRDVDDVLLETDPTIGTISITTTQPTPDLAASLATTYAEELQGIVDERASDSLRQTAERVSARLPELAQEVEDLQAQLQDLGEDDLGRQLVEEQLSIAVSQLAAAQNEARLLITRLNELEAQFETLQVPAPVSTDADAGLLGIPTSPIPRFAIFGLLSLILGSLLAFAIDYLDTKIRTREDAEQAFGLPVVAELPPRSQKHRDEDPIPVVSDPTGITAESFRSLRLSVLLAPIWRLSGTAPTLNGSVGSVAPVDQQSEPKALLVTSPLTGDGKSTTVANLAASFAESGQRVLVVDCDFRRPAVGELLRIEPGEGLQDLKEPDLQELEALIIPTGVEGVRMIRSGKIGIAPSWFLTDAREFVGHVRELADVVIFDTGPITLTNEASALIPAVDSVLLVNRAGRLTRSQARGTVEQLTRIGATMAGIIMVGTNGAKRYGYYTPYTPETEGRSAKRRSRNRGADEGSRKSAPLL
jgi:capsular exopolysaccharide synthesis family protein